jgi:hypothetical protein
MSTTTKVKGKIKQVLPLVTFVSSSGTTNTKQEYLIVTDDKYNPNILVEVINDKIALTDGEIVDLDCNVKSKHWKDDKWFTSIEAWKKNTPNASKPVEAKKESTEDLPF